MEMERVFQRIADLIVDAAMRIPSGENAKAWLLKAVVTDKGAVSWHALSIIQGGNMSLISLVTQLVVGAHETFYKKTNSYEAEKIFRARGFVLDFLRMDLRHCGFKPEYLLVEARLLYDILSQRTVYIEKIGGENGIHFHEFWCSRRPAAGREATSWQSRFEKIKTCPKCYPQTTAMIVWQEQKGEEVMEKDDCIAENSVSYDANGNGDDDADNVDSGGTFPEGNEADDEGLVEDDAHDEELPNDETHLPKEEVPADSASESLAAELTPKPSETKEEAIDTVAKDTLQPPEQVRPPLTKKEWLEFAGKVAQAGPRNIEKWLYGVAKEVNLSSDDMAVFLKLFMACRRPECTNEDFEKIMSGVEGLGFLAFGEALSAICDYTWHRPVKASKMFGADQPVFHEVQSCNRWNARHYDTDSVEVRQKGGKPATCCHPVRPHYLEFTGKLRAIAGADEVCLGLVDGMGHMAGCMHVLRTGAVAIRDADLFLQKVKCLGKCCQADLMNYLPQVKIDPGKYPLKDSPKPAAVEDEDANLTQPLPDSPGAKRNEAAAQKLAAKDAKAPAPTKSSPVQQLATPASHPSASPKPAASASTAQPFSPIKPIQPISDDFFDLPDADPPVKNLLHPKPQPKDRSIAPISLKELPPKKPPKKPDPDIQQMARKVRKSRKKATRWLLLVLLALTACNVFFFLEKETQQKISAVWEKVLSVKKYLPFQKEEPSQAEKVSSLEPSAEEVVMESEEKVEDIPVYESHADIPFSAFGLEGVIIGIALVDHVTQIRIEFENASDQVKDISLDRGEAYITHLNVDHKVAAYQGDLRWVVGYWHQNKRMHPTIQNGETVWVEHNGRTLKPKSEISGVLQFRSKIDLSQKPVLHLQDMEGREVNVTLTP